MHLFFLIHIPITYVSIIVPYAQYCLIIRDILKNNDEYNPPKIRLEFQLPKAVSVIQEARDIARKRSKEAKKKILRLHV